MNPWLRLLAVLVAAVVAALLLKALPPVVVLVAFIGGVAYLNHVLKTRAKTEAARDEADVLGLRRETQDVFGLLGYPLALFGRGTDPRIEDLVWGTWRGLEVKRFDVSFEPVLRSPGTERPRFSCAIAPLGSEVPHLVLEPWTFVTRMASEVPMRQVATGSERLDAAWYARCDDEGFVADAVDEPMSRWLVDLGEDRGFEVSGRLAMVYGPAASIGGLVALLEVLQGFLDRMATVVLPVEGSEGRAGLGSGPAGPGTEP